jgi:hypothetical protein
MNTTTTHNRKLLTVLALAAIVALAAVSVPDNLTRINTTVAGYTVQGTAQIA